MSTVNRLQCLEKLGEGTYGVVYKAKEIATGQIVAFKRMIIGGEEEGAPATAIREVCLLKELKHDNIVRLYDVLFEPPKLTLIFEYCEFDLKKYMERKRKEGLLDVHTEVQQILKQILVGLRYMHRRSVVHRDLKPENIFLHINHLAKGPNRVTNNTSTGIETTIGSVSTPQGFSNETNPKNSNNSEEVVNVKSNGNENSSSFQLVVKLGDYGLARVENIPVKKYSHDVVSLWYRSPDAMMGSALYGFAVDMWSVGCIFAEMVTGKPLLNGCTEVNQLLKIFRLLGTPTLETWPSMMSYPKTPQVLMSLQEHVREQGAATPGNLQNQQSQQSRRVNGAQRSKDRPPETKRQSTEKSAVGISTRLMDEDSSATAGSQRKFYNFPPELRYAPSFDEYVEISHFRERAGVDGVDLLQKLVRFEPAHRLTAHEALCHPFLKNITAPVQRPVDAMAALLRQTLEEHGLLEVCDAL